MDRRDFIGALAAVPLAAVVQPKTEPAAWCLVDASGAVWRDVQIVDEYTIDRATPWEPITITGHWVVNVE